MPKKKKKRSKERRIQAYLKPRAFRMFVAESKMMLRKLSENAALIIQKHYDSLNPNDQNRLLSEYDKINQ